MNNGEIDVRPIAGAAEAGTCADMMTATSPWTTFGLTKEYCLSMLTDPARHAFASHDDRGVSGFIILDLRGSRSGKVRSRKEEV